MVQKVDDGWPVQPIKSNSKIIFNEISFINLWGTQQQTWLTRFCKWYSKLGPMANGNLCIKYESSCMSFKNNVSSIWIFWILNMYEYCSYSCDFYINLWNLISLWCKNTFTHCNQCLIYHFNIISILFKIYLNNLLLILCYHISTCQYKFKILIKTFICTFNSLICECTLLKNW